MNKLFILGILSIGLIACENRETRKTTTTEVPHSGHDHDADNTGRNIRDRNLDTRTPVNQSESEQDRAVTQRVRQALVADDTLSTNAKNVKIITINGVVTLRGPVGSADERSSVERKAKSVAGATSVDNQIEITSQK